MYLKNDYITATVAGVTFTSHMNPSIDSQYNLDPTAFTGWLDGVSVRRPDSPRMGTHGDFVEKATLSSRLITFQGLAISKTPTGLKALRDRLMGILSGGAYDILSVQTSVDTRYSTVGLEGKPSWVPTTDLSANWKIDFYAPDPFIYGEQKIVQTGAFVSRGALEFPLSYTLNYQIVGQDVAQTITNKGNAESWPIFRVVGDYYSGFTISNNLNKKITYNGIVTMQSPVTVNMAKGTAIQGGVDKTVFMSDRGWFSIPPEETIQPEFVPLQNGSGWCEIIYRDTWV